MDALLSAVSVTIGVVVLIFAWADFAKGLGGSQKLGGLNTVLFLTPLGAGFILLPFKDNGPIPHMSLIFSLTLTTIFGTYAILNANRRATSFEQQAEGFRSLALERAAREATLAHEIRTPLALVRGAVELLEEETPGPLNPRQRKFVHSALTHSNQLSALAENLLAQASLEAELFDLDLRVTDLRTLLRRGVTELRRIHHHATLLLDTRGAPVWLPIDRVLISQALFNLINNSVRHSRIENPTVTIRMRTSDHEVTVSVGDNGRGMSKETQRNLFTPYIVGDSPNSGTGLGMSVTRQIVQLHGGKILIDSVPGRGTTIFFTIPRRKGTA